MPRHKKKKGKEKEKKRKEKIRKKERKKEDQPVANSDGLRGIGNVTLLAGSRKSEMERRHEIKPTM